MFNSLLETLHNLQKKPRFWTLLFFFALSLIILIAYALESNANTWDVIFQTFFATILTASLIELSVTTSENYLKESDRRYFRQLFSCDFDTDESVAIVLPAFNIEKPKESKNASEEISQSTTKELADAGSKTAQWVDVITASNIVSAFSSFGLPAPKIIRDDEAVKEIEDENNPIKTFISIGLLSNKLTLDINKRENENMEKAERYFKIEKNTDITKRISNITIYIGDKDSDNKLKSEDSWSKFLASWDASQFKPASDNEYVLFAKSYLQKKKKTVIVLGGCMRTGTEIGGEFIVNCLINYPWKETLKKLFDLQSNKILNTRQFAVVYKVTLKNGSSRTKSTKPTFEKKCPSSNNII